MGTATIFAGASRQVLGEAPGKFRENGQIQMAADRQFTFGQVRFDSQTGELWHDGNVAKLTPRAAAVLCALAERAQQLVTKQELLDRVWAGRVVSDDALTSCIQELRGALKDDARRPRYIETRHRRGYRLLVPIAAALQNSAPTSQIEASNPSDLVGRAVELADLARAFEQARSGRRQLVFVTGEPGIGKSSLADAFLEQLRVAHARGSLMANVSTIMASASPIFR